jgi:hypothetical protein
MFCVGNVARALLPANAGSESTFLINHEIDRENIKRDGFVSRSANVLVVRFRGQSLP